MTITVSPVTNTQTFGAWLSVTNRLAEIATQNSVTADASAGGSVTTGNSYVNGHFGAGHLYAETALIGGNVSTNSTLNILANVNFTYSAANLASITANGTSSNLTIRTENTAIVGNTLFVNATINAVSAVAIANTLSVANVATFNDNISVENIVPQVNVTYNLGTSTSFFKNTYTQTVIFATGSANSTQYTGTANNANNLNGQPASFYTNATNITTGTLDAARLSGTYTINVTGTASNATNLNNQPGSFYTNATNITTGVLPWAQAPSGTVNTSGAFTITGIHTHSVNVHMGNTTVNTQLSNATILISNSTSTTALGLTDLRIGNTATNVVIANTTSSFGGNVSITGSLNSANVTAALFTGNVTGTASNATNLNSQPGSFYTNATNLATGTVPTVRLGSGIANSTTFLGGDQSYKTAVTSVTSGNGLTGGPITTTGTVSVLANSGIIANTTGVYVNATSIAIGTVSTARLGTGTANSTTFLGGDQSYKTAVTSVTSGSGLTGSVTTTGSLAVLANNGIIANATGVFVNGNTGLVSNSTGVHVLANNGIIANATGVFVNGNTGLVSNSTGVHVLANSGIIANTTGVYVNASSIAIGTIPTARLPASSTTQQGIVQLIDSVTNSSITLAATANSVKTVYDYAATIAATGTPPSGANTNIQFNNSGAFGGSAAFTFNSTTNTVAVGSQLNIGANVIANTTAVKVGNTTVNAVISAGVITLNGVNVNTAITGNAATAYANAVANAAALYQTTAGLSANVAELTANNSTNFNGQPASFYTNATNITTGTLGSGRLSGSYTITASNATNLNNQPDTFYTNASNISTGTLPTGRLSGSYTITASNATNLNNQPDTFYTNASNISTGTLATARLPATVNVATQVNVGANVGLSVDTLRIGNATVNTAISAGSLTFNGINVNTAITGNASTAYTNAIAIAANATNLTSGTVNASRLSGTYTINVTGTASNATNLNSQPGSFYTNATNISTGTLATARLPATVAVSNTFTIGSAAVFVANGNVGLGTSSPAAKFDLVGDYKEGVVTANTSTAYTVNLAAGTVQNLTLTGSCTFTFPAATPAGRSFLMFLRQDATGNRTVTWPGTLKWPGNTAPTLTSTASRTDMFAFTADGTSWFGRVIAQNYS